MPDWKEATLKIGRQVWEDQQARADERHVAVFSEGFDEAANICVSIVAERIAELMTKIQSGSYLSTEEQFLLSRLTGLKEEMEKALHSFFDQDAQDR
ncbi:hypothetical protein [Streptomyces sp. NPDC012888]|uniref:hypothetical protein n=1 Tax=Streptomyces sp. NPDC012888 TaxID=3364855 RepID=UPI0036C9F8E3